MGIEVKSRYTVTLVGPAYHTPRSLRYTGHPGVPGLAANRILTMREESTYHLRTKASQSNSKLKKYPEKRSDVIILGHIRSFG